MHSGRKSPVSSFRLIFGARLARSARLERRSDTEQKHKEKMQQKKRTLALPHPPRNYTAQRFCMPGCAAEAGLFRPSPHALGGEADDAFGAPRNTCKRRLHVPGEKGLQRQTRKYLPLPRQWVGVKQQRRGRMCDVYMVTNPHCKGKYTDEILGNT